jgi:hypothetical protein
MRSRMIILSILASAGLAAGLELLCRGTLLRASVALLAALLAGALLVTLRLRRRGLALLSGLASGALGSVAAGLWPELLLGALIGTGGSIAGQGLAAEPRLAGPRALRWLLFPELALIAAITELAYLRRLPYALLDWPGSDKVVHALLFGLAVLLLELWLDGRGPRLGRLWLPLSLLAALAVAGLEEGVQTLSPARSGSLGDLAADLLGMAFGVVLARLLLARCSRPLSPPALRA